MHTHCPCCTHYVFLNQIHRTWIDKIAHRKALKYLCPNCSAILFSHRHKHQIWVAKKGNSEHEVI